MVYNSHTRIKADGVGMCYHILINTMKIHYNVKKERVKPYPDSKPLKDNFIKKHKIVHISKRPSLFPWQGEEENIYQGFPVGVG